MDVEAFPAIEDFQHLPRNVIVKGGTTSFRPEEGAELRGILINNIGQPIQNVRVHVVIFDDRRIPLLKTSVASDPDSVPQGGISSFRFKFEDLEGEIKDYHLFANWSFEKTE